MPASIECEGRVQWRGEAVVIHRVRLYELRHEWVGEEALPVRLFVCGHCRRWSACVVRLRRECIQGLQSGLLVSTHAWACILLVSQKSESCKGEAVGRGE